MPLMLSWLDRNNFNNYYPIEKDERYIIIGDFGESGSYGASFWEIFLGHKTYKGPRRWNQANDTPYTSICTEKLKHSL